MALNRDFVGRTYAPSAPYEVSRVKIRSSPTAIGDGNPIYRDREAAQAAGHPGRGRAAHLPHRVQPARRR